MFVFCDGIIIEKLSLQVRKTVISPYFGLIGSNRINFDLFGPSSIVGSQSGLGSIVH
jgi:hypothetical protein